jgi:hypothetical protein
VTDRDWQPLLDAIAESGNLTKACRELGLGKSLFLMDCANDRDLADRYARAREAGLDAEADRAIEEAVAAKDAGLARVALDARKWYLSKLMPQKYGDKLALGGAADLPAIKTEALDTSSLDEATLRAIAAAKGKGN